MNYALLLVPFLPLAAAIAAESPKAVLAERRFDFGTVKRGDKLIHKFPIRNEGSAPLNLERGELSLPGMNVRYRKTILPGEEGTVTVEWNTDPVKGKQEGEILVYCNDPTQRELRMVVEGTVQPPIEFQPYGAVFLSLFQGQTGERAVRILNHQDRPVHILKLEPSAAYIVPVLRTVEDGRDYELTVKVGPQALLGRRQETVSIQTDDAASPQLRVMVNLFIKTDIYANPERIDFGEVSLEQLSLHSTLKEMVSATFLVKKRTGKFAIQSVTSDLPALVIRQQPDGESDVFQIDVKLAPADLRAGELSGTIRIETNDVAFPELRVPVTAKIH
jgi:hypothetical protein